MRKVQKDLVAMKVVELKDELGERGEALSGSKAWLRRRLHAATESEKLASAAGGGGGSGEKKVTRLGRAWKWFLSLFDINRYKLDTQ